MAEFYDVHENAVFEDSPEEPSTAPKALEKLWLRLLPLFQFVSVHSGKLSPLYSWKSGHLDKPKRSSLKRSAAEEKKNPRN
ncbi:hypothetical protein CYMTET_55516, partial [Cymbomonas tetramitiformis]